MKKSIRIVSILVILLVVSSFAYAKKADKDNTLVVAMELQFPPFETSDNKGNPKGISVDIAKALGKYLGKKVEIRNTAWDGLIPALKSGSIDIVLSSMSITEERKKSIDFSDPYAGWYLSFITNKTSGVTSFDDLKNKKKAVIAIKTGTTAEQVVKSIKGASVLRFDSADAAILEVAQGKADAFIYDPLTVFQAYEKNKDKLVAILDPIPNSNAPLGIAIAKGNDELKSKINAFIAKSKKDKLFEKLAKKHLGSFFKYLKQNNYPSFFDTL